MQYLPTDAIDIAPIPILGKQVAKINDLEKMPMRNWQTCGAKCSAPGAKEHDLDIHDPFGKGLEGTVAVTYRDPRAPRMPGRGAADTAQDGCRDQGW